jgi:hypothetical protein
MLLAGGFFTLCAVFYFYKTATNDRGLILNGLLEFGAAGATAFYCTLGVLSLMFVLSAVLGVAHGLIRRPVLIVADDYITVPGTFLRRRENRIVLSQITAASIQKIYGQQLLTVWSGASKVTIARSMMPSQELFDRLVQIVAQKKEPNQSPEPTSGLRPAAAHL